MKTLIDAFKNLKNSYYGIEIKADELFNEKTTKNCCDFIQRHFDKGKKTAALNFDFFEEKYNNNSDENAFRHVHTVSLYLLGLTLEGMFSEELRNSFSKSIKSLEQWYCFKYTWFLTCLYHDAATFVEQEISVDMSSGQEELDFLIGNADICYTPYNHTPQKRDVRLTRFSEGLIRNYFRHRANSNAKDHGIYAGYFLFDRLKKNFFEKTQDAEFHNGGAIVDGLNWRKEHLDHFAYIADAIICHNIWMVLETDVKNVQIYKTYGLEPLIIKDDEDKLHFSQYPLQFILCLLDSVEPIKRFNGQLKVEEVLKNINIESLSSDNIGDKKVGQIKISWTDEVKKYSGFYDWQKNIVSLKDWMSVEVSACCREKDYCYLTIDIN